MNGTRIREAEDPEDMRFHEFLYRPITTSDGTFKTYLCNHRDHPNCVLLVGREYDPDVGGPLGVYYHTSAGHIKRNIVADNINWELAPMETTISKVHGEDGTGRNPKVESRMNKANDQ